MTQPKTREEMSVDHMAKFSHIKTTLTMHCSWDIFDRFICDSFIAGHASRDEEVDLLHVRDRDAETIIEFSNQKLKTKDERIRGLEALFRQVDIIADDTSLTIRERLLITRAFAREALAAKGQE